MINIQDPYLRRLAEIESGMNPLAKNPNSSAGGLFQFIDSTAEQYGLQDRFNPEQAIDAASRLTEDNRNYLRRRLGREPSPGELYLAHQQGATGAANILANPNAPAADIVGPQAVALNAGGPGVTAGDFANQWIGKFEQGYQAPEVISGGEGQDKMMGASGGDFIEVEAPDGQIIEFPSSMADADIEKAMAGLYPAQSLPPDPGFNITAQDLGRTAGRTGRNIAAGLASAADVGLLIPKTIANIAEFGLEKTGLGGSALEKFAEKIRTTPSMRESSLGLIDQATGNTLQPQGGIEKTADFVSEMLAPVGAGSKFLPQAVNMALDPSLAMKTQSSLLEPVRRTSVNRLSADDIKAQASKAYKLAREKGGTIKAETTNAFLDDVSNKIMPQTEAGKILSGDSPVTKIMDRLNNLRNRPLTLDEAQEIDEFLGDAIDGLTEMGRVTKQGKKLLEVQDSLRNIIDNADIADIDGTKEGFEALKKGRQLWARSAKLRDVEKIITRAEMSQQPANALKSGFRTLYNNPKRMRGFSKAEKEAVRKAAESGIVSELLTGPASRLFGIGSALTGGPSGYIAGKGIEMSARGLATKNQLSRAQALENLISSGGNPVKNIGGFNPAQAGALSAFGATEAEKMRNR